MLSGSLLRTEMGKIAIMITRTSVRLATPETAKHRRLHTLEAILTFPDGNVAHPTDELIYPKHNRSSAKPSRTGCPSRNLLAFMHMVDPPLDCSLLNTLGFIRGCSTRSRASKPGSEGTEIYPISEAIQPRGIAGVNSVRLGRQIWSIRSCPNESRRAGHGHWCLRRSQSTRGGEADVLSFENTVVK